VKSGHPFERQFANPRGERRDQGRARAAMAQAVACVAADARLIAERAATRGRSAMEGGDQRAGAKGGYPPELQPGRR
jgi:hypothetical protein